MSIGKFLLNKENLDYVGKNSFIFGKKFIIEKSLGYYDDNPAEVEQIVKNLEYMNLASSGGALDDVLKGLGTHYFDKLFILTKVFEMHWLAKNRIDYGNTMEVFEEAKERKVPVFVGHNHFGASYFMGISLMIHGLNVSSVGKFPEPVGSIIKGNSEKISEKFGIGKTNVINLADPDVDVAWEMFNTLLRGGILSNVFDESNEFSGEITMLGKKLIGGSGMDLILKKYNDEKIILVTPFIIRTGEDTFRFELDRHYMKDGNIIQSFYNSLGKRVEKYPDQWYFIHELHEAMP